MNPGIPGSEMFLEITVLINFLNMEKVTFCCYWDYKTVEVHVFDFYTVDFNSKNESISEWFPLKTNPNMFFSNHKK